MPKLKASTTDAQTRRATRAVIAWTTGDKLALDTVLDEVMADPTGVPALLFDLADLCAILGTDLWGEEEFVNHLRQYLAPKS